MPINVNDITSAEWSLSLRGQGEVEQGFDDINQCIKLIVSTQRGTDPMRPNFGCDLWRFMDYGINVAAARMTNEILSALATWETRIEVTNINYSTLEESVTFNILWILQGNKQRGSASITLDFAPQRQTEAPPVIIAPIDVPVLSAVYTYPDGVLSWTFPSPIGVSFQILRSANGGALEQIDTAVGVLGYTDLDLDFDTLYTYVAYYDTISNAEAGTATGRLALGISNINTYLTATGWASGQAIRIFNTLGATLQAGELVYKATPFY
jgi:uncharacterized protein